MARGFPIAAATKQRPHPRLNATEECEHRCPLDHSIIEHDVPPSTACVMWEYDCVNKVLRGFSLPVHFLDELQLW